jgi:broad specificity phosphatase PhoE
MTTAYFITHPNVLIDPTMPVRDWRLSARGRERMTRALALPWVGGIRAVWCSTERKARDSADILVTHLSLPVAELAELGENDRQSTGYLPREKFEAVADRFFGNPLQSVCGWERAIDAQDRIASAVGHVLAASTDCGGDVAILAHGGVGTLLLCLLRHQEISRRHDQPANNGGNYFAFDVTSRQVHHDWRPVDG